MTIETAQAGNWVAETFTNVDDYLALGGTSGGYVRFRDAFRNGDTVFYSAVDDDNNREAGSATFQDGRLVDRNITAVLRSGVYEEGENLPPVNFRGTNRIVSGTFNQYAFEKLWAHIFNEDNPHNNPFGVPEAPADGKQYSRKNEGWSEIVALGTGAIPDAPVDGKLYGRENAQWTEVYIDTSEFDEIVQDIDDKIEELDNKLEEIENGTINSAELSVSGNAVIGGSTKSKTFIETVRDVRYQGGTATLQLDQANNFQMNFSESSNYILGFSGVPSSAGDAYGFTLTLDTTGMGALVWDDKVIWPDGEAPALEAGTSYVFAFITNDNGTTFKAFVSGQAFA
jgi:hypothetical protein